MPTPGGCETILSACCPTTAWHTTNSTLIGGLSFCARDTGSIAPRVSCADNGRILLANSNQWYFNNLVMTPPQSGGLDGCEQPQGLPGLLFERWLSIRRLHPRPQSQAAPDCGCNGASALLQTPPLIPRTPWPRRPPRSSCVCGHPIAVLPQSPICP